jgi:hypothetical protein
MPKKDCRANELKHAEEVFEVAFPTGDDAAEIMHPGKQSLDLRAATTAAQRATVLRGGFAAIPAVRGNQLHTPSFAQAPV